METLLSWDLNIVIWARDTLQHALWNPFWIFITTSGNKGAIWIALGLILLAIPKYRKMGILVLGSLFFSALICNIVLKNLIARPRPFTYFPVELLVKQPHDFSFPSGHTSASFAAAYVLIKERFTIKNVPVYKIAFVLAVLISFSRLYLSLHFTTDIIGGICVGLLSGYLSLKVFQYIFKNMK